MSTIETIFAAAAAAFLLVFAPTAYAIEGDVELGGQFGMIASPERNVYGGGAEIFARYDVIDGLWLGGGVAVYGARDIDFKRSVGLYSVRLGALYTLDILEWVPAVGVSFSKLFSESTSLPWMKNASHGFAADFEAQLQYRGFPGLGIALVFDYHLAIKDADYMTFGFAVSWHSDSF